MNINGRDTLVLFDIMSHSQTSYVISFFFSLLTLICHSDSGIGDHGLAGIKSFLDQHTCNYVCKGLNLTSLGKSVTTKSRSEGEGEDVDELDQSDKE